MSLVFSFSFFLPLLWAVYFIKKDCHPEPKKYLIFAFFLGILSALLSFFFEGIIKNLYLIDSLAIQFLIFAFIEEFFKFLVVALLIFPLKVFDEPIDAVIYMTMSAFGFAFVENLVYALSVSENFGVLELNPLTVLFLRFLSANFLHILASVLLGFGYAYFMKTRIFFSYLIGLFAASFLHFLHNYLIIKLQVGFFLVIPILWGVFSFIISEFYLIKDQNELSISRLKPYEEI